MFVLVYVGDRSLGPICANNSFFIFIRSAHYSRRSIINTVAVYSIVIVIVVIVVVVALVWFLQAAATRRLFVSDERDDVGQREDEMTFATRQQIAAFHHTCSCRQR